MCGSPLLCLPNPHGAVITPWIRRCAAQKQQKTASSRSRIAAFGHPPQTTGEQVFSYLPNVRTSPNQSMSVPSSRVGSLVGSKPETMYTTRRAADTA